MATRIDGAFPELELGPGATIEVDTEDAAALVTGLTVYGVYYPPAGPPTEAELSFLPAGPAPAE